MGAIYTDMEHGQTRTMTVKEWAGQSGINPDTARRTVSRKSGRTVGQLDTLTAAEWQMWKPGKSGQDKTKTRPAPTPRKNSVLPDDAKPAVVKVPPPAIQEPEQPAKAESEWEFWVINFLEMSLIVVGLSRLYEWPGLILAAMCCLFLFKAQRLARDAKKRDAVQNALRVVLAMCVASGLLHLITFWNAIEIRTQAFNENRELATDYWMLTLKIISALLPAVFVAFISFNAVSTTAKIHQKNN